jgi:hypothetical protein
LNTPESVGLKTKGISLLARRNLVREVERGHPGWKAEKEKKR